jgi:hypothetical protein
MAPTPKRQPALGAARIDWADPINRGLALYFLPAAQPRQDLARKTPLSYVKGSGTYDRRGTEKGQSLLIVNDRSNNQYTGIDVNGAARPKLSGPFTLMFYGRPSSFTSSFIQITGMISAFADQGSNGPVLRWGNDGGSGQSRKILAYANIGGSDRNILAPTDSVAGTDYLCLMTYDGAVFSLWVNGALIGSIACSGAVGVSAYNRLTIGADYVKAGSGESSYGNRHFAGDMYAVGVWERGFTFEEARNFTAYQPLRAMRRPVFRLAGAGQDATAPGAVWAMGFGFAPGAPSAGSTAAGATLPASLGLVPGAGQAASTATGATLPMGVSLVPGAARADSAAAGAAWPMSLSWVPGSASGSGSATAPGASWPLGLALVAGQGSASSLAAGAQWPVGIYWSPGAASGSGAGTAPGATWPMGLGWLPGVASATGSAVAPGTSWPLGIGLVPGLSRAGSTAAGKAWAMSVGWQPGAASGPEAFQRSPWRTYAVIAEPRLYVVSAEPRNYLVSR